MSNLDATRSAPSSEMIIPEAAPGPLILSVLVQTQPPGSSMPLLGVAYVPTVTKTETLVLPTKGQGPFITTVILLTAIVPTTFEIDIRTAVIGADPIMSPGTSLPTGKTFLPGAPAPLSSEIRAPVVTSTSTLLPDALMKSIANGIQSPMPGTFPATTLAGLQSSSLSTATTQIGAVAGTHIGTQSPTGKATIATLGIAAFLVLGTVVMLIRTKYMKTEYQPLRRGSAV